MFVYDPVLQLLKTVAYVKLLDKATNSKSLIY